jgi:hypothetical protein
MAKKPKRRRTGDKKYGSFLFWWTQDKYTAMMILLNQIYVNQQNILDQLNVIKGKGTQMAINLDALTAEVQRNTDVEKSVLALVGNLVTQLNAIPPSSDPTTQAALDALKQTLSDNDDALAAAVTANTPAAP